MPQLLNVGFANRDEILDAASLARAREQTALADNPSSIPKVAIVSSKRRARYLNRAPLHAVTQPDAPQTLADGVFGPPPNGSGSGSTLYEPVGGVGLHVPSNAARDESCGGSDRESCAALPSHIDETTLLGILGTPSDSSSSWYASKGAFANRSAHDDDFSPSHSGHCGAQDDDFSSQHLRADDEQFAPVAASGSVPNSPLALAAGLVRLMPPACVQLLYAPLQTRTLVASTAATGAFKARLEAALDTDRDQGANGLDFLALGCA